MKPSCDVEIKTSLTGSTIEHFRGNEFRRKQWEVMVAANVGGIATSANTRIRALGLLPTVPLPPMGLLVLYFIPGQQQQQSYVPPGQYAAEFKRRP